MVIWILTTAEVFLDILKKFKLEAPNNGEDNAPT